MNVERREFIQKSGVLTGGIALGLSGKCESRSDLKNPSVVYGGEKSRVSISHRTDLRNANSSIHGEKVQRLLDAAIENLYQEKYPKVWSHLFNKNDVVGLKINCLAGRGLSTSAELVDSVIERLREAGVAKQNIIVWDRMDRDLEHAGFKIYRGKRKVQYYGTNRVGFTSRIFEYGAIGSLLSRILYDQCTAIINMPILKDHGIVGISVGLKNFFGVINNPNKYHDDVGDPYVADVNMIPAIRKKTRLTICDALTPQYEGGPPYQPQWTWQMDSVIAATDMVAMDYTGWQIIEKKRKEAGLESLKEAGREPTYIATAADSQHRLGTDDPTRIDVVKG